MARAYVESTALELDKHVLISKIQTTEGKQYTFCPLTDIVVGKTPVDTGLSKRKRRTLPVVGTRPEEGVSGGVGTRAGDSHCAGLERGAVAPSPCARGLRVAPAFCSHHWCGHGTHKCTSIIRHARPARADTAAALSLWLRGQLLFLFLWWGSVQASPAAGPHLRELSVWGSPGPSRLMSPSQQRSLRGGPRAVAGL